MTKPKRDPVREERIENEAVVVLLLNHFHLRRFTEKTQKIGKREICRSS
jgi:hypothetical protein